MVTLTYYPGCSLKASSKFYDTSIKSVFSRYGVGLREIADWSCCGASAAHTVDETLAHALAARNLSLAELEGNHFFAPCSACYNRSKTTNEKVRSDDTFRDEINGVIAPLRCLGTSEVINILEVLHNIVGLEKITRDLPYDIASLKVVSYYGCVLTRMPGMAVFDDVEDPTSMDNLLWATGANPLPWPFKMECCGASKTLTSKETTLRLSAKIMAMAHAVGADAIVTTCPLCQMNLDLLPHLGKTDSNLPVLFLTEVLEYALFGKIGGGKAHMIPVDSLSGKVKKK